MFIKCLSKEKVPCHKIRSYQRGLLTLKSHTLRVAVCLKGHSMHEWALAASVGCWCGQVVECVVSAQNEQSPVSVGAAERAQPWGAHTALVLCFLAPMWGSSSSRGFCTFFWPPRERPAFIYTNSSHTCIIKNKIVKSTHTDRVRSSIPSTLSSSLKIWNYTHFWQIYLEIAILIWPTESWFSKTK